MDVAVAEENKQEDQVTPRKSDQFIPQMIEKPLAEKPSSITLNSKVVVKPPKEEVTRLSARLSLTEAQETPMQTDRQPEVSPSFG